MVEIIQERSRSSVYGEQPRSLNINWMKYNVLTHDQENANPNTTSKQLSPLREKLRQKGEEVMQKRSLLTRQEVENKIEEARLRRENASAEAIIRRVEPAMRRSQHQVARTTYLSQVARARQQHEEARINECQQNIRRITEREASLHSCIAEVDEQSEHESMDSKRGLEHLANMNGDLEELIRAVYAKIKAENSAQADKPQQAAASLQA